MRTKLIVAAVLTLGVSTGAAAQDAKAVIDNASKAIGADGLNSITFSGTAANINFGQTKNIAGPYTLNPIANYTRTIDLNAPASRASGQTAPAQPGGNPGNFNQNITAQQAGWNNQLEIALTPWGFLRGASANGSSARMQRSGGRNVISYNTMQQAPSGQPYTVTGYINDRNEIERVETRLEHPILGDMLVENVYENYQAFGNVRVPTRITQRRAGRTVFQATIASATANPPNLAELMTPPAAPGRGGAAGGGQAPAGGGQGAAAGGGRGGGQGGGRDGGQGGAQAAAPAGGQAGGRAGGAPPAAGGGQGGRAGGAPPAAEAQKLADGLFRITGNYMALAADMGDHIVVIEGGQSEARGLDVIRAVKGAIPGKPIRYVVNSHPHFDHASGLAPFVAEGATIITHENNEDFLEDALNTPRTLVGDTLAKARREANVDGVGDRRVLRGGSNVIELHHVRGLEHSDGMLMAYLPNQKILYTADFTLPAPNAPAAPINPSLVTLQQNIDRLKLDYQSFLTAHPPNPDRPLTRADVEAVTKK